MKEFRLVHRFNADNIGGMKEIMVKAHALAKLTREDGETYAHAFKCALKTVWRKIKRSDSKKERVYLWSTGNEKHPFELFSTSMPYLKAVDWFVALSECERRGRIAIKTIEADTFTNASYSEDDLFEMFNDYIYGFLPCLHQLEIYDCRIGYDGNELLKSELKRYISNTFFWKGTDLKEWFIRFIDNYCFGLKVRIRNELREYGKEV